MVAPTAGSTGLARDRLHQRVAAVTRVRGMTLAMPGSAWRVATSAPASGGGSDELEGPGAPGPKAACTGRSRSREVSLFGTTLIDGMPVFRPSTGSARARRIAARLMP